MEKKPSKYESQRRRCFSKQIHQIDSHLKGHNKESETIHTILQDIYSRYQKKNNSCVNS